MSGALNIKKGALKDGTVVSAELADGTITKDKIANGSITSSKLAPSLQGVEAIENGSISSDKLADDISVKNLTVLNSANMSGNRLQNVGTPISSGDTASKGFVTQYVT